MSGENTTRPCASNPSIKCICGNSGVCQGWKIKEEDITSTGDWIYISNKK